LNGAPHASRHAFRAPQREVEVALALAMTRKSNLNHIEELLLLRADPADALDLKGRSPGFLGDFLVLLVNEHPRGFVTVQAAEKFGRHAAVGALGAVFIEDVEKGEFAFGISPGFLGHMRLLSIRLPLSNEIAAICAGCLAWTPDKAGWRLSSTALGQSASLLDAALATQLITPVPTAPQLRKRFTVIQGDKD